MSDFPRVMYVCVYAIGAFVFLSFTAPSSHDAARHSTQLREYDVLSNAFLCGCKTRAIHGRPAWIGGIILDCSASPFKVVLFLSLVVARRWGTPLP